MAAADRKGGALTTKLSTASSTVSLISGVSASTVARSFRRSGRGQRCQQGLTCKKLLSSNDWTVFFVTDVPTLAASLGPC